MENVRHFSPSATRKILKHGSVIEQVGVRQQILPAECFVFWSPPEPPPPLLMISVYVGDDENKKSLTEDYFARKSSPEDVVNDFHTSGHYKAIKIRDLLRNDYRNPIWFEEAVECTPNDTVSRRKIWEDIEIVLEGNIINPEIDTIRTITTKQYGTRTLAICILTAELKEKESSDT